MITDSNNDITMREMMEQVDASMKTIHRGQIINGKIISINDNELIVNIGYMTDGIIPRSEIIEEGNLKEVFKIGEEIYVYIMDINDGEGNVLLSKKRADKVKIWDEIQKNYKDQKTFDITVNDVVKGGVVTNIKGIRAFIPASQISVSYVKDLKEFLGKTLSVKIIEFDAKKEKIVLSSRVVEEKVVEEKREKLWNSLQKGEKRTGVVKKLVKFGAFVDIGGIEGLVHLSDLSWKRVLKPEEVVSVGDKVEVYVLDFNKNEKRLSLAIKDVNKDPWNEVKEKFKINDVVEGKVMKLLSFGAFVEIMPGVEGLVHISEICEENITKPSDKLNLGDTVKVKILELDAEEKRISLSIKEAIDKPVEDYSQYLDEKDTGINLGELLKGKLGEL